MPSPWTFELKGTVTRTMADAVQAHADRVFLDIAGQRWTYGELHRRSNRLANALTDLGVRAGDTVFSMLDSHIDCVATWHATNKLGGIWVPANTALKGGFLRHVAADSGAAVYLTEPDYAQRFAPIRDELPELTHLVVRTEAAGPVEVDLPRTKLLTLAELLDADDADLPDHARPADLTCLTYTGGTTGPSKGCMISHNYMLSMAHNSLRVPRGQDDVSWTPLPLFHLNAASAITSSAVIGSTHAVAPRFSLSGFWPEIKRTGATRAMLLGAMINLVANMPDTPEMRACHGQIQHMGGAPYTADDIRVFTERFGITSVGSQVYGLTECAPLVSAPPGRTGPWGSSGRANELFDVRIVDEEDRELPAGEVGEVIARPLQPHVMFEGYWRRPEATQAVMRNMWFHTGDLGRFDDDGWFWFVDRKKDYMRRRGENVSSRELEVAFGAHPDVSEVVAHAVPSELSEDDIKVVVVRHEAATVTEEELLRWSFDRVPYYAIPRYIEFRDELPKNAVGRALKYQLRAEGVTPATWDRDAAGIEVPKR